MKFLKSLPVLGLATICVLYMLAIWNPEKLELLIVTPILLVFLQVFGYFLTESKDEATRKLSEENNILKNSIIAFKLNAAKQKKLIEKLKAENEALCKAIGGVGV